jgi:hypothetical protein
MCEISLPLDALSADRLRAIAQALLVQHKSEARPIAGPHE